MLKNELTGQPITDSELESLSQLVLKQIQLQNAIDALQAQLEKSQEEMKQLSEGTIPDLLLGMGLSQLKMQTGEVVSINKYYSCSIKPEAQEDAFAWLRKTGNDDIIKNELKMLFGKGEDERARAVAQELLKQNLPVEQKIFVHPMTLKSFVKERMESGAELPTELFGVYVGNKTKITPPKK